MRKSMLSLETHNRGLIPAETADYLSQTYTTTPRSCQNRRSIMSIASLKPAKGKLQKLWPASTKGPPSPQSECKDWGKSDLSAVIRLAGFQMSALGNPTNPIPSASRDGSPTRDGGLERSCGTDAAQSMAVLPPSRAPPPPPPLSAPRPTYSLHRPCSSSFPPSPDELPPPYQQCSPHSVPSPNRAPPPPPIHLLSELSPVNYDDGEEEYALAVPPKQPVSPYRRRAKTPVHQIGQLERAARHSQQETGGLNRMSSVSTIARQYRELVVPDDEVDSAQPLGLPANELKASQTPEEHRRSTSLESSDCFRRRSQLAPSLVSDDGTLVALEEEPVDDAVFFKSAAWSPPEYPLPSKDEDATQAPAAPRFSVGLDMLTRELSSAIGSQSRRDARDASGLQISIVIEAYERLRDQIAATGPDNKGAQEAIESWLKALHAIHRDLVDEAAMSESEYGD